MAVIASGLGIVSEAHGASVYSLQGGAIYNEAVIGEINGDFTENYLLGESGNEDVKEEGRLSNYDNAIPVISQDFVQSHNDLFYDHGIDAQGGAIYNSGTIDNVTGDFRKNSIRLDTPDAIGALGGAIYNAGSMRLTNSSFYDNYIEVDQEVSSRILPVAADVYGGAILNMGNMAISADNGISEFSGNKVVSKDVSGNIVERNEAIFNAGSIVLNAVNNGVIRFDDKINGIHIKDMMVSLFGVSQPDKMVSDKAGGYYIYEGETLLYHLIKTENGYAIGNYGYVDNILSGIRLTGDESSRIEFGNAVEHQVLSLTGDVTAVMKSGSDFSTSTFNVYNGKISLIDEAINRFHPMELNLISGVARLGLDIDLANKKGDFITADEVNILNGSLFIDELNILTDETSPNTKVAVIDTKDGLSEATSMKEGIKAYGPIYKYDAAYDKTTGEIEFVNAGQVAGGGKVNYGDLNPDVAAVPVNANAGVYVSQANVYREALGNSTMRQILPTGLASGDVMVGRAWLRPFMSDEEVSLDNGPKVDNRVWGTLVGLDSQKVYFDNCWDGVFSAYVGTTGSRQKYDGVRINQKSAVIGATAMFSRGDFWSGVTTNVMYGDGKAHTRFGEDDFHNLSAGLALKAGRNFYLGDGFTLQPSFMGSYTYVKTSDYTTAAGVSIDSDPLHMVQLTPGLRLMWEAGDGWIPYLGYSYYWNLIDDSKVKANDIVLPEISVKPYSEYVLGVIKQWDVVDSYFQLIYRSGGRDGVDIQTGISYEF